MPSRSSRSRPHSFTSPSDPAGSATRAVAITVATVPRGYRQQPWEGHPTGCVRNGARFSATGRPSASPVEALCAGSRRTRTSCRPPVPPAAASSFTAARPATPRSRRPSRSTARSAKSRCARPSSTASRSAATRGRPALLDRREADDRDEVVASDLAVVELAQEVRHLLRAADLGVVVLDLPRREVAQPFHLDLVDHRVENVLPRPETRPDEHGDDHPLLVLARLVAEPDRRRLAV